MKSFTLKITAAVIDQSDGKEIVRQSLEYSAAAPAIHDAIQKMGASCVHGLSVSLSSEMLGLMDAAKKEGKSEASKNQ